MSLVCQWFAKVNVLLYLTMSLAVLATGQLQAAPFSPYELHYSANYKGLNLTLVSELQASMGVYTLEHKSAAFMAEITETSVFTLDQDQLVAQSYAYKRNIFGAKQRYDIRFDQQPHMAFYTEKGKDKNKQYEVPKGVFDYINYPLKIRQDLIKYGSDYPQSDYQIARKHKLITYTFKFLREELLDTPLGKLRTVMLEKVDDDKTTQMWMAVDWEYVIVKLYYKDDNQEMNLQRGKVNGKKITGFSTDLQPNKLQ